MPALGTNSAQQDETLAIAAGATTTVIRNGAGRLRKIIATAAGTASTTFYDDPAAAQGTVLFVTPVAPALGQTFDVNLPAAKGIYAVGIAGSAPLTVST
jgi:hypothetical protein